MSGQMLRSSTAFSREPKLILINACPNLLSFYMGQHFTSNMEPLVIAFEVGECNPLISVGCFVHYWVSCAINKQGFLRLY